MADSVVNSSKSCQNNIHNNFLKTCSNKRLISQGKLMRTRLSNLALISIFGITALAGCDNGSTTESTAVIADDAVITEQNTAVDETISANTNDDLTVITDIDWSKVDSGEQAADRTNYTYPFDLDSQNVRDYANYFKVAQATAQHNLTIGMASNEALSKVLDQLSNSYTSHELTDGETVELIIHTKPEVNASRYDYVFSEDFAKGLVLPIVIVPDGKKDETVVNPHEEVAE